MTIGEALRQGRRLLTTISDEASLEAELLLAHVLKIDRVHLYQRLGEPISPRHQAALQALLQRRLNHEPTPYIIGHRQFYGLDFLVTPAAIIPRPETELLVEAALAEAQRISARGGPTLTLVDVGAGCGAIACAIATHLPQAQVIATDAAARALALAQRNACGLGIAERIRFLRGDLLKPVEDRVDVIAANLPYVKTSDWQRLPPEIRQFEPRRGLDGGPDGLRLIRRLLRQAPPHLKPGGALLLEIGHDQAPAVKKMAAQVFPQGHVEIRRDLAGLDRLLLVRR